MSFAKYNHSEVENRIYSYWEKNNLFKPKKNKKKFSIVIPPPNVTGRLHMGHALNNSIQDFLTRYHRMNNYETLWQPGTDHAGIATQALVEKELVSENIAFRETEISGVQSIINKRVKLFKKIFKARQVELAMKEVPTQIKAIREHAVSSVFKNEVSSLDDDVQELINRMMSYMEKRCIAIPIKAAKEHLAGVVSSKK